MARYTGPLTINGRLGGLVFYTDADGRQLVRAAGGPDGHRVRTAPEYARSRENAAEFGRAARASRLLRHAFQGPLAGCWRGNHARLVQVLHRLQRQDATSARGARQLTQAALAGLAGFEWNAAEPMGPALGAATTVAGGVLTVTVPPATPALRCGGVLVLAVVGFEGDAAVAGPVAEARAVLDANGGAALACPLPSAGLWVAALGVLGRGAVVL